VIDESVWWIELMTALLCQLQPFYISFMGRLQLMGENGSTGTVPGENKKELYFFLSILNRKRTAGLGLCQGICEAVH
jgi:hypothetical protein